MLAHIDKLLGFIEEVENLKNFPEITDSNEASFKFGLFDYNKGNPIHSKKYDDRLFDSFSNAFRKIVILQKEPISLYNTHKFIKENLKNNDILVFDNIYNSINKYLNSKMNDVTNLSFDFPGSIIEKTNVFDLLNNFFAAKYQHSKPNAQKIIYEINVLTSGSLTEIIRLMMIDIIKLLNEYVEKIKKIEN